ncbi:MAG: hypothetical protein ACJ76A_06670 [Actinomycetota bacterium]
MTRDPAAQAVHDRLEHVGATMPEPDIEAGWAALVAQLEPPVAPVVPLRRRQRPRRTIVLGIAAAVLIAGTAFAAVRHAGTNQPSVTVGPRTTSPGRGLMGPHTHLSFSRTPVPHSKPPVRRSDHHHGGNGSVGVSTPSSGRSGATPEPTHRQGSSTHHDSPHDTGHDTGNDGTHNDNGQGNDAQGQDTQGNGDGSSAGSGNEQGSGNDQGSGSAQGSGDRGTHASGGGHGSGSGTGSETGHGSSGQGED